MFVGINFGRYFVVIMCNVKVLYWIINFIFELLFVLLICFQFIISKKSLYFLLFFTLLANFFFYF